MTEMPIAEIEPYDPDSEHGREIADELSTVLAEVQVAIADRKRKAAENTPAAHDAA